jgi:hypothetical protein
MLHKVKAVWSMLPIIVALCLSSCVPTSGTLETKKTDMDPPARPVLKTTMGDFVISSTRLVDEVHDQKSPPGEKFLLVVLTQSDLKDLAPDKFSLDTFQKMIQDSSGQIYTSGKNDSQYISTMAGWVEDEFTIGFPVPVETSYTLHWPGNSPIDLRPVAQ